MSKRGPKPKTTKNSLPVSVVATGEITWEPASTLDNVALKEFWRLVGVLDQRGTLERIDPAVLTEAARVTARLNQAYADDDTKVINQLTTQRRGLLREMGLSIQPSRSVVKTIAKDTSAVDPIAGKIKIHG